MVFSSLTFLLAFLPLFFLFYYLGGKCFGVRGRNIVLLIFSLFFYAWGEPLYVLLMLFSIVFNYCFGLLISSAEDSGKKLFLVVALIGNLGLLAVFKYLGLFAESLGSLIKADITVPEIALPIGISFYTFQTMSYIVDVYRGKVEAQHDIIDFGAYVAMFPQLIAGPIVRYESIAAELENRHPSVDDKAYGIRRFIAGLGKKTLIANVMASTADSLFSYPASNLGALGSWIGILAFTLQIYFDFSGYSDMAIGLGRIMGFSFPENFNDPYSSTSITDFWRRWHISLSSFFRDYVYIPLGGNRVSVPRWLLNIFVVWFLTGLWHGASWNFVLWGLYFGILLVIEKFFAGKLLSRTKVFCHIWALFFIVYGWVLFSQESLGEIVEFTKAMFGCYGALGTGDFNAFTLLQQSGVNTVFLLMFTAGAVLCTGLAKKLRTRLLSKQGSTSGDLFLIIVLLLCILRLMLGSYNPFIYFRF